MTELQDAVKAAAESHHQDCAWKNLEWQPPEDLAAITQQAIDIYLLSKAPNGTMGGIGWWQSANGYTAMALRDLWSGSRHNYKTLSAILRQCEKLHPGFINEFNDDTLWWAMCCMHMYSMEGDSWFLEKAKGVWQHIRKSGSVCGRKQVFFKDMDMEGGVFWTTRRHESHVNAISTGLFAELSARLALVAIKEPKKHHHFLDWVSWAFRYKEPTAEDYIEAARCSLGWILRCRYRPQAAVVLDHVRLRENKAIDWTFTYNTGVAIGTCALLYEATREEDYMILACHMSHQSMRRKGWVEDSGILTEAGAYGKDTHDPWKNNDAVGFKAVLMRQLGVLYDVIVRTECQLPNALEERKMIEQFVNVNLQSQLERNTNGHGQYGPWWNGPFEAPTSHSQMAALDVMAAAMLVNDACEHAEL